MLVFIMIISEKNKRKIVSDGLIMIAMAYNIVMNFVQLFHLHPDYEFTQTKKKNTFLGTITIFEGKKICLKIFPTFPLLIN